MSIGSSDIHISYSTKVGAAGGSTASDAASSLGKYCSTTDITDATLNNLFADLSGDDNANSVAHYKCFFVRNAHATLTWQGVKVWITAQQAGGADATIGLDDKAVSDYTASAAQAEEVADDKTAPANVVFSNPTSKATGLSIGDLAPGKVKAIWAKIVTPSSVAALNNDSVTIRVEGDTAA